MISILRLPLVGQALSLVSMPVVLEGLPDPKGVPDGEGLVVPRL
jgi:hypothetical protein